MSEKKPTFDISALSVTDTTDVELVDAKGEPLLVPGTDTPMSVTVYGPGSKPFAKAQATRNRAVLQTVRRGARKMKDEEQRDVDAEFLATCTASFNGFDYKGMVGHEGFKALYLDPKVGFIAEQVNKAISDWSAFTNPSATT